MNANRFVLCCAVAVALTSMPGILAAQGQQSEQAQNQNQSTAQAPGQPAQQVGACDQTNLEFGTPGCISESLSRKRAADFSSRPYRTRRKHVDVQGPASGSDAVAD